MAAQATHPRTRVFSGTRVWQVPLPHRRGVPARRTTAGSASRAGTWTRVWKTSIVSFAAISLAAMVVLVIGFAPGRNVAAIVAVVASVATGVLGQVTPRPPAPEVLRPTRGEAF